MKDAKSNERETAKSWIVERGWNCWKWVFGKREIVNLRFEENI